jgi:hypothetical protein
MVKIGVSAISGDICGTVKRLRDGVLDALFSKLELSHVFVASVNILFDGHDIFEVTG